MKKIGNLPHGYALAYGEGAGMSEPESKKMEWTVSPALCLDLEGTVRYNKHDPEGLINRPEDVAIFPDVEAKLWEWRNAGYLVLGVSNQGGVAFGYKAPQGFEAEVDYMSSLFQRNPFHFIVCCYNHPEGTVKPFNHRSLLRKPYLGMLALMEWELFDAGYVVDWEKSIMVGDRFEDASMATKANIGFIPADMFFGRGSS